MPETSAYSTEDLRRYQERYGLEPTTTSNKGNPPITAPNAIEDLRRYQERYGLEPLATPKAPTPPRDPFSETFSALGAGVVSTAEGLAGTAEMIGIPGAGSVRKKMQEVNESDMLRRPDYLATETVWEKPERLGDWRWWVRSLGENLPNMATMMLPGVGAARAAKAASWGSKALFNVGKSVVTGERAAGLAGAWTGSMALESGSAYGQAKDEMTKAGTYDADTIERIATLEGVAAGTANSLLELLPFDNLFLKQAGADRFLKRIVRQSFLEGSTEAAQEAVNIYVEKLGHKPDQLLSDNIGRMLESAIVGGALGGAAGATLGTHEHRSNVKQYNALGEELGVTPKIYAMKEAGMSDPNIATALDSWIKTIRTKMEQKPKGADAMTTGGSEVKDAARKPTIPEIDAEEMVSYLLYGDGKYTPPPGVFGQAAKATTTRAKKGVLGIFGMKEKVPAGETAMPPDASTGSARTDVNPAEGPTAADLGTLATGAVAGKDIALKEPLVQKIDEAKKAEIRQEGQSTFDLTLGDITLEDQEKLDEARQRELLVKQQAVEQEAAAIATQAQSTLAQAAADTAAVGKEISGGDPAKQALVAQVMALSDRVVQTELQKELGLDVRPAGQDMYAILTADGEKSVPMVELRKLLANKLVANYDAAQVAQANAAKQHLVDVATAQKRSEEARIQKEAAIATQALASTRETLQMGRTTTPQQMELLPASRDKLTPAEIAKLDARVAAVQGQAAAAQEQQAAVVPEPVQEIQAAAAQVVPSNALQMLGARRDIPVVPVEEGPAPLSAAQDEAVPDAQVIEELLRIMTSQLANTSTGGLITNKDGEKKWMAQGGWISETAKSFRNQSTTQLRDAKGKPVTANIDVARLKTIFKRARNEEQLTEQEQTILTVALRAAHAEETQARKTIEEAAAAQANSAAADDFNPREFAGSETPTTEAEPSTRETILQTAVDRGEIDSFNDTGAWIGDAFIPDARLKVLKDRSVAAAGTSPPSPAVALASGVNFGGNIRAADAAALVDHAHVLRAERQTTGQKEITALGKDGISALAEKATDGDFESLAKLDSLLADVTGGPGSFYKTGNWGADHYVKALGKYLPALPDMGKSTPSQSVALATGQKKVVPEKAAAVSTEPAWMQTRDKYIQSARDPEKTKDRDRQWGALQSLLQKNQDEGKREGLITTNQWRTFVDKFGDPDTVSNDRFHFFDDPQGMGKIVKGAALTEERQHRQAVADAVAQGENIPDEVKGDYPDLFPKTGESAPPSPAVALAAGQKTAAAVTTGGQDQIDRLDALITAKRESLNSVLVAFDKLTDPEKQKKNIVQRNNIVRDIQSLESQRQKYVDAMPDAPAPTSSNAVKLATGQKVTAPAVAAIPVSKVAEETVTTPKEQKAYVIDKLDGLIDAARENWKRENGAEKITISNDEIDARVTKGIYQSDTAPTNAVYVEIDVPNDGQYKVENTLGKLLNFRTNMKRMSTAATPSQGKIPGATGLPSNKATGKSTDTITEEAQAEVDAYNRPAEKAAAAEATAPAKVHPITQKLLDIRRTFPYLTSQGEVAEVDKSISREIYDELKKYDTALAFNLMKKAEVGLSASMWLNKGIKSDKRPLYKQQVKDLTEVLDRAIELMRKEHAPTPTSAAQPESVAAEYIYKSPSRPLWIGFGSAIGVPYTAIDQRTFSTKTPLSQDTIYKLELEEVKPEGKAETAPNTEDAGAELTYNKRNRGKSGIKWDDIADKNMALKVKEATKQNVYPRPDYQAMIDGGMQPVIAHIVKQVYDKLAATPNTSAAPTDTDLKLYIDALNRVMAGTIQWATDNQSIAKWAAAQSRVAGAMTGGTMKISDLAQSGQGLLDIVYPGGWKNFRAEVIVLGGNKALAALQPSYDEGTRAIKAIKEGWPATQESWQKQGLRIIDGATLTAETYEGKHQDGKPFVSVWMSFKDSNRTTNIEEKFFDGVASKDDAAVQDYTKERLAELRDKSILINKNNRIVGAFDNIEAAQDAARENVKRESKNTISDKGISVESAERIGPARRMEGEDITSDRILETFGYNGLNFGNWLKGESNKAERQLHLNHIYDSGMDMAELLNVPPKALSLNGMLGIAIGAQGTGKAAAHFVPGVNEINLTRTGGAGAFVHEQAHGIDHYFAVLAGLASNKAPYLSDNMDGIDSEGYTKRMGQKVKAFGEGIRTEIVAHFKAIVKAMNERPMTQAESDARRAESKAKTQKNVDGWLKAIAVDFRAPKNADTPGEDFDRIAARIRALDLGEGWVSSGGKSYISPAVAELRDLFKKQNGHVYPLEKLKSLQANLDHLVYVNSAEAAARRAEEDQHPQTISTDYQSESQRADKDKGGKKYWSTEREMFARAFDAYITDKLAENAAKNTYLSGIEAVPPKGEERIAINKAFDGLVGEIKTRETDKGVAMYSLEEAAPQGEAAQIVAEAKKNGTYLKGPNGKDTRLTPAQWVQVRTKAFKEWFGDWEKAGKYSRLLNMQPIKISVGSLSEPAAFGIYDNLGSATNRSDNREVFFVHSIFGKLARHKEHSLIFRLIPDLKNIFEQSVPAYFEAERDQARHNNVVGFHNYVTQVRIDGQNYYVRTTIQEVKKPNGNELHSLFLSDMEIKKAGSLNSPSGLTAPFDAPTTHSTTSLDVTLSSWIKKIKADFNNASKVVDENGEPLVVYNASAGDFNIYRRRYERDGATSAKEAAAINRFGKGIFFSSDANMAGRFGSETRAFFLKIDELNDVNLGGASYFDGTLHDPETGEAYLDDNGNPVRVDQDFLPDEMAETHLDDTGGRNTGVVVRGVYENIPAKGRPVPLSDTWIVGNPAQIKSATDNVGTFDGTNPDIRYSAENAQQGEARGLQEAAQAQDQLAPPLSAPSINALVREWEKTMGGIKIREAADGSLVIETKSGQTVEVKGVEQITPDSVSLSLAYGTETVPEGKVIAGQFLSVKTAGKTAEIHLVRDKAGVWTMGHEFYHFLEEIGAISNEDKNLLNRKIRSLVERDPDTYAKLKGMSPAEQRADWTSRARAGLYDATTPTGKIIQKLKGIVDQVLNALGIRTAGGVVRDIQKGRIYDRGGIPGTRSAARARYMVAAWHGGRELEGGKFDPTYIGSAQGTAVGWGFYFSDLEEVGRYYANMAGGASYPQEALLRDYFKPGSIVPSYGGNDRVIAFHWNGGNWGVEVKAVDEKGNDKKFERSRTHSTTPDQKDLLKVLGRANRNLYQVSLHKGKEPGEYTWLDWDKPLTVTTLNKIKLGIAKNYSDENPYFNELKNFVNERLDNPKLLPGWTGEKVYNRLVGIFGSSKDASDFLLRAGIDGNRVPVGHFQGQTDSGKYNYVVFDPNAITVEKHIQYAMSDKAEQLMADKVAKPAAKAGSRALSMMGAKLSPETKETLGAMATHWKEFWQPFSTVPDGDKILAKRYEAMGNVGRAVRFIDELFQKVNAYPDQVKKDMFWYLNGDVPIDVLPEDVRETAEMIRRRTEVIGEMLVDRGIIAEGQFEKYRGKYIHYMYAKHVMGEDKPIFLTSSGKLNLSYTKSRNTKLTMQQKKELGLIEDASVAVPVGMGKALTDIAKYDYLQSIAENADWVWQPSLIKVPVGKALTTSVRGRTRRNVTMGIGKLVEEVKTYDAMMAKHPTPEVAEIHRILHEALDKAEEASENMPSDFVQLPNSKGYGPLAGAFIRKPIADDIMPVLDVATDRGKLMNTIIEIERQGMATFKMGKVALNVPTAARNIVSNIIQNNMRGRSLPGIIKDIIAALEAMKAKNEYYEEAFGMGLFHTNWFVSEINDVLDEFRKVKGGRIDQILILAKKLAKYYGQIDDVNKLSIFIEQRKAGKTIDEATLEAMKWGMDYSLTSRSIKGLRQTIMPFATYMYKIAPLIAESLKKRPWVLAKFGLIYTAAKAAAMSWNDLDDDDWEDLEKQLPAYIKKSGSMMILPWKTDKGQWQWVNLEYFFPWGNYMAIARDMKSADLGEGLRDIGLSNPFLSMLYTGLSAREDQPPLHSYFGTPIYNQLDPAPMKAAKLLEYMANIWMPSMITRQGAIGYTGRAIMGGEDRWGREVSAGQALGRWFGVNIVSVSPEQTRAQASVRIQDLRKEQSRIDANPSYDEEDKKAYAGPLNEKLAEIAKEAPAAVLPITKAKGKDPVYEALQAMAAKGILHTAPPSRSVEIAGTPYKMTLTQYREYIEKSSEIAHRKLEGLVSSPTWEAMSDKRKSEVVSGVMENARKGVRQKIKAEIARESRGEDGGQGGSRRVTEKIGEVSLIKNA